ncbi:MAG: copper chaperone PCu(A)C [Rhodanobacter sp.]
MNRTSSALFLSVALAGLLVATSAYASAANHVSVSHAWIRVLPGDLPAGGYATLQNNSDQPVSLSSASSTAYAHVMLHHSSTAGGVSRMTTVKTLAIPAHGSAILAPAGYHLMLSQPVAPVSPGDSVKLILKFTDGSTLAADFAARPANALGSADEATEEPMGASPHNH